ncbi:hypothetical protein BC938DRAFT_482408, partial [Jimgerdemannia flammicorona]
LFPPSSTALPLFPRVNASFLFAQLKQHNNGGAGPNTLKLGRSRSQPHSLPLIHNQASHAPRLTSNHAPSLSKFPQSSSRRPQHQQEYQQQARVMNFSPSTTRRAVALQFSSPEKQLKLGCGSLVVEIKQLSMSGSGYRIWAGQIKWMFDQQIIAATGQSLRERSQSFTSSSIMSFMTTKGYTA